jgi:chemotaxis protein MotB
MEFEIPANYLFLPGTAKVGSQFVEIMDKVKGITVGLEDSNVYVDSLLYYESVRDKRPDTTKNIAEERLDIVKQQIDMTLENDTVSTFGRIKTGEFKGKLAKGEVPEGVVKIRVTQKENSADGRKPRKLDDLFGKAEADMNVYDNFVQQVSKRKLKTKKQ